MIFVAVAAAASAVVLVAGFAFAVFTLVYAAVR